MSRGPETVHLVHPSGAAATVCAGYGANLDSLRLVTAGQSLDLLEPTPAQDMPASWGKLRGVPVMFPFPGRVERARYRALGRDFSGLPVNDPDLPGNHLHGLVATLPWTLAERTPTRATCRIGQDDLPASWRKAYPFPFDLQLTHVLHADRLEFLVAVANPGAEPLPFGFGLHPYFALPFAGTGTRATGTIELRSKAYWPQRSLIPTGKVEAVPPELDLGSPRRISALHGEPPNTVYGLDPAGLQRPVAILCDPASRTQLEMRLSGDWHALVLFRPPQGPSLCVEPQTCVPNAVNLHGTAANSGWLELPPHSSWSAAVELRVCRMSAGEPPR